MRNLSTFIVSCCLSFYCFSQPSLSNSLADATIISGKSIIAPINKKSLSLTLKKGQTFGQLMRPYGLDDVALNKISKLMADYLAINKLQSGAQFDLILNDKQATAIEFDWEFGQKLLLSKQAEQWQLKIKPLAVNVRQRYVEATVNSSLYVTARKNNIPSEVIKAYMVAFSHLVNFKKDLKKGDEIKILYSEKYLAQDEVVSELDELLYLEFINNGKKRSLYKYQVNENYRAYYDDKGKLVDSFLMKKPVSTATLSSYFGRRTHPVLGYKRLHRGVDFSAPVGTPILAAGDGKVVEISSETSFGNLIKIGHKKKYFTLYAHLSDFTEGLKIGDEVKQGQIIGYLGNTGLSAARHLHYEVHKNKRALDPLKLRKASVSRLSTDEMPLFIEHQDSIKASLAEFSHQSEQKRLGQLAD